MLQPLVQRRNSFRHGTPIVQLIVAKGLDLPFSVPFFTDLVDSPQSRTPEEANAALLETKVIGGLPLGRFFPELKDSMLLCATEMSKRADIDAVKEVLL